MTNIAIFVSGNGSNCENIIKYFKDNTDIKVRLVVSNKADAYALTRAAKYGVPCRVLSKKDINDSGIIIPLLEHFEIDFIVLAGFMLMVPEFITEKYDHKIVNIHPSLLPKFGGKGMYGMHVHRAVLDAGETESGITIQYVNEKYDEGDYIFQAKCPVLPDDTPETLAARVHQLEYRHYPEVIERLVGLLPE